MVLGKLGDISSLLSRWLSFVLVAPLQNSFYKLDCYKFTLLHRIRIRDTLMKQAFLECKLLVVDGFLIFDHFCHQIFAFNVVFSVRQKV